MAFNQALAIVENMLKQIPGFIVHLIKFEKTIFWNQSFLISLFILWKLNNVADQFSKHISNVKIWNIVANTFLFTKTIDELLKYTSLVLLEVIQNAIV